MVVTILIIAMCGSVCWGTFYGNVHVDLTAIVDRVYDSHSFLDGTISSGDKFSGSYQYSVPCEDSDPLFSEAEYMYKEIPQCYMNFKIGGHTFATVTDNSDMLVQIWNDVSLGDFTPKDYFGVRSYNNLPLDNGTDVLAILWQLQSTLNPLADTSLLLEGPVSEEWDWYRGIEITGGPREAECKDKFHLWARVTSVESTFYEIPEPATVLLLICGSLITIRKKK